MEEKQLIEDYKKIKESVRRHLSDVGFCEESAKTNKMFALLDPKIQYKRKEKPADYVSRLWEKYKRFELKSNSLNGSVFEAIVFASLIGAGLSQRNIYIHKTLAFAPDVEYDIILFPKTKNGKVDISAPVVLSMKTSLRERYKQAANEGWALKNVYMRAEYYLLTVDSESKIQATNSKIKQKELRGIDEIIDPRSEKFNNLVSALRTQGIGRPQKIDVLEEEYKKVIRNRTLL